MRLLAAPPMRIKLLAVLIVTAGLLGAAETRFNGR